MTRIRALWARTNGDISVVNVDNSGPALGKLVGGYLEVFYLAGLTIDPMDGPIGLADEEGLLKEAPVLNPYGMLIHPQGPLVGDIVIVRAKPDGDFGSLTVQDLHNIGYVLGVGLEAGGWTKAV